LTAKESAAKEVYEEAGVAGNILQTLGKYEYKKKGRDQKVTMYSMLYTHDTPDWPEKGLRKRKWFSFNEAKKKLSKVLQPFLQELKDSNALALSASNNLSLLADFFRELPILAKYPSKVTADEVDNCVYISVSLPNGDLRLQIEEWEQHPLSQALTIHYWFSGEDEHKHFKRSSLGLVVGHVARIIGKYAS
jgi:ADP-ribose pyrophosphatase YjhB (NUDIX family)